MENSVTIKINCIFSKDLEEAGNISTKGGNVEIMMGSETDEIIEELFKSFLQNLFLIVLIYCIINFRK